MSSYDSCPYCDREAKDAIREVESLAQRSLPWAPRTISLPCWSKLKKSWSESTLAKTIEEIFKIKLKNNSAFPFSIRKRPNQKSFRRKRELMDG